MKNKSIFSKEDKKSIRELFRANLVVAKEELTSGKPSMTRINYIQTLAHLLEK